MLYIQSEEITILQFEYMHFQIVFCWLNTALRHTVPPYIMAALVRSNSIRSAAGNGSGADEWTEESGRRKADPDISVMDLQGVMEKWIAARAGNRNVANMLSPVKAGTWKTSPAVMIKCFVELSDLWTFVFALAPNGMLPRKKLDFALEAVHEAGPIMFAVRNVINFCGEIGGLIRKLMSRCCDLCLHAENYRRVATKATEHEHEVIEKC